MSAASAAFSISDVGWVPSFIYSMGEGSDEEILIIANMLVTDRPALHGSWQGLGLELSQWLAPAPSLVTLEAPHYKGFPQWPVQCAIVGHISGQKKPSINLIPHAVSLWQEEKCKVKTAEDNICDGIRNCLAIAPSLTHPYQPLILKYTNLYTSAQNSLTKMMMTIERRSDGGAM